MGNRMHPAADAEILMLEDISAANCAILDRQKKFLVNSAAVKMRQPIRNVIFGKLELCGPASRQARIEILYRGNPLLCVRLDRDGHAIRYDRACSQRSRRSARPSSSARSLPAQTEKQSAPRRPKSDSSAAPSPSFQSLAVKTQA